MENQQSQKSEVWQEVDCPVTQMDFDLYHPDLVHLGQVIDCIGCGKQHVVTEELGVNTYSRQEDGTLDVHPLPKTEQEKLDLVKATS